MTSIPNNFLLIGNCGVGKTWVMLQLMKRLKMTKQMKYRKLWWVTNGRVNLTGKYDRSEWQGSDKLSMAVMQDVPAYVGSYGTHYTVWEGDRFSNSKFISLVKPFVIRIDGSGEVGRKLRGSNQAERHLKSIATRVSNLPADLTVANSTEALDYICKNLNF